MVTSDFTPEVEIRPFRACAMKNMQYKPYLWPNCPNVRVFLEIGVGEHDGDVRFFTGSGNTAVSRVLEMAVFPLPVKNLTSIIGTVRSLWTWTWLWGRYHVPQNAFLVFKNVNTNDLDQTERLHEFLIY